jgi:DNA polymerase III delta prime subunit
LGEKRGAIADLQKAAILFDRQGNKKLYQVAIDKIKKIQASNAGEF